MGIVALVLRLLGWACEAMGPGQLGVNLGVNHFNAPGDLWVRAMAYALVGGLLFWVASLIDGKRKKRSASTLAPAPDGMGVAPVAGPEPVARTIPEQPVRGELGHRQALEPTSYYQYCANCGRRRTSGEKFCHGCGAPLTAALTGPPGQEVIVESAVQGTYRTAPSGVLQSAETVYGGFWIRFVASAIDWVALTILSAMAGFLFVSYLGTGAAQSAAGFIVLGLLSACYVGCTPTLGATPGKLVLGYHIVGSDGRHISYRRTLGRELSKILSAVPLLLGFVWVGIDARKQGWHDKIAETYVVRKEFVDRKGPSILVAILGVAAVVLGIALATVSSSHGILPWPGISSLLGGSGRVPNQTLEGEIRRTEDQVLEMMRRQIEMDQYSRRQQNPNLPVLPVPSFR